MKTFCQQTQRIRRLLISVGVAIVTLLLLLGGGMTLARAEPVAETTQSSQVTTGEPAATQQAVEQTVNETSPPATQPTAEPQVEAQASTPAQAETPVVPTEQTKEQSAPEASATPTAQPADQTDVSQSEAPVDVEPVSETPQAAPKQVVKEAADQVTNQSAPTATQPTQDKNTVGSSEVPTVKPAASQKAPAAPAMKAKAALAAAEVTVTNEQELNDALNNAPIDGTVQTITLGSSFQTVKGFFIKQGQNVTFVNQGDPVQIDLGSQIKVEKGGTLTFKGNQKDGILIVPAKDFQVPRNNKLGATYGALCIDGTVEMTNTTIKNFTITPPPPSSNDAVVTVNGGKLTMNENAIITHNHLYVETDSGSLGAGGISVTNGGTVIMNKDSYVTHNSTEWGIQNSAGGISVHKGSQLIINGGHIDNNAGPDAGGIEVGYVNEPKWNRDTLSTVIMNGGSVDENISWNHSGGIFINGHADVTINGGSISRNQTGLIGLQPNPYASGGAIVVHQGNVPDGRLTAEEYNKLNLAKLTINDAIIDGNHAAAAGGGIYVNSNNVTINKATITNNVADIYGGGIYVSTAEYTLHLGNSLITGNEATDGSPRGTMIAGSGGGIWFCPTGDAEIYVTDGTAIYGNKALNQGDEVLSEAKAEGEVTTLANRMLGGGGVKWYHDRDGQSETDPVNVDHETAFIGLKNVTSDAAKAIAASLATVLITGNKSPRGGGIGSNGSVIFGNQLVGTKTIKVTKDWQIEGSTTKPDKVIINIVLDDPKSPQNGGIVDSIELDANSHWQGAFEGLPTNIQYKVTENEIEGFTPLYGELKDLGNNVFEITVTNKAGKKDPTPDKPGTPDKPTTPPDTPNVPIVPGTPPVTPETPATPIPTPVNPTSDTSTQVTEPSDPEVTATENKVDEPAKVVDEKDDAVTPKQQVTDNKVNSPVDLSKDPVAVATPKQAVSTANPAAKQTVATLPQTGDQESLSIVLLGILLLMVALGGIGLNKKFN
ncbi:Cna B-type domain-containing protein [Lentilactobacillus rapi]|nr:Cna B-type domain-containing protein [Lentilactobacillus rapi]